MDTTYDAAMVPGPDRHPEHCRDCKTRLHELLTRLYPGACHKDHSFPWPSAPEAYRGVRMGEVLQRVFDGLAAHRGYRDFVRTPRMPRCDYFIASPGFILEFDERQHFTRPRAVALSLYPADLRMGFSVAEWRRLCKVLCAEDPTPPDRDERRAWYDSLRDLLPMMHGLRPTVRLYEGAMRWCDLRTDSSADIRRFEETLNHRDRET